MGRPPKTLGVWTAMVAQAGSVEALAEALAVSRSTLSLVFTAQINLPGPSRKVAEAFAREHGILARLYIHPRLKGYFLVSNAEGWWAVRTDRPWSSRAPSYRYGLEDWSSLPFLELPFTRLGEILRQDDKTA